MKAKRKDNRIMAEFLSKNDRRTHYCGTVRESDIGNEVCLMGWVQRQRDLGALIFIDLRDRTGIVQLAFDNEMNTVLRRTGNTSRARRVLQR